MVSLNLKLVRRNKAHVRRLTQRHINERFRNARKLYEQHLADENWQWLMSLHEAWVYNDDINKPRAIYYQNRGAKGRSDFVHQFMENFFKGFMVIAGYGAPVS